MKKKALAKKRIAVKAIPLTVELVPRTSWRKNLRNLLSREAWFDLKKVYGATTGPCPICGAGDFNSPLHLHEVWKYDDDKKVQKLIDLQPICQNCHNVKHIGRTFRIGLGEQAIEQLTRVNNWDFETARKYLEVAFLKWEQRSNIEYTLDVSYISPANIHWEWLEDPQRRFEDIYDSIQWAKRILDSDALILDTETTGLLDSAHSEVIQIAVVNMNGDILYNKLIRPKRKIPKRVIDYHHITNEKVAASPVFPDVFPELESLLQGKTRYDQKVCK